MQLKTFIRQQQLYDVIKFFNEKGFYNNVNGTWKINSAFTIKSNLFYKVYSSF